jgi:hypothetical protein
LFKKKKEKKIISRLEDPLLLVLGFFACLLVCILNTQKRYTPEIPELWRLRQEDYEFKASMDYVRTPIPSRHKALSSNPRTTNQSVNQSINQTVKTDEI